MYSVMKGRYGRATPQIEEFRNVKSPGGSKDRSTKLVFAVVEMRIGQFRAKPKVTFHTRVPYRYHPAPPLSWARARFLRQCFLSMGSRGPRGRGHFISSIIPRTPRCHPAQYEPGDKIRRHPNNMQATTTLLQLKLIIF